MSERRGTIGISDDQEALLESAARYCADKSPIDAVRRMIEDEDGYVPEVFAEMAELGWLGVAIPEEYGGSGLGFAEVVPIVEEMGRRLMGGPLVSTTLAAQVLLTGGTEAQKSQVLPQIATGTPATIALSERHADFDPLHIECRAVIDGDRLALSGEKCLVPDAGVAQWALVSVVLDGAPALVLLDAEALAACALQREQVIDETRRSFRITLDGVSVPIAALLDPARAAATLARAELAGSLLATAEMCGGGASCVAYIVEYLTTRKQFGRLIGSYQALKHPTVDAHLRMEQARSHLYAAAHTFERADKHEGEIAVRMAKAHTGPALAFVADRAIQFHGGFGFTYECDAQLYRRRALWGESQYGDAMHQRRLLAELIL